MNLRISKIIALLNNQSLDAAIITSVSNITYLTDYSNFSNDEREAYLFITKSHQYILTDGRYTTEVKKHIKDFELIEISSTNLFKDALMGLLKKHSVESLGIEEEDITVSELKRIQSVISNVKNFPTHTLRLIKEASEINLMKKACQIGDKAFKYILTQIKPGITEKQIASKLANYIRENSAEISFSTIVAFGENAAVPHHQTGDERLSTNDLILLDFGVKYNDYCSDMTRTFFLGQPNAEQKKIYDAVLNSQMKSIEYINSHLSSVNNKTYIQAADVDYAARNYISSLGYPSIPHSLGHGIGIEVHESPTLSPISKHILTEGMVFSIEPGIYLPGKFGIRIEDLFVIEKAGLRQLTNSSKELIQL